MGVYGGSDGKESACNAGDPGVSPWIGKMHWQKEWQPTPVFLPGEFHGQIFQSMELQKSDKIE